MSRFLAGSGSIFHAQQEIRDVHRFNSLIIPAGELIGAQDILGVVIPDFQQTLILPLLCLFRFNALCDLNIELLILTNRHKVDLSAGLLADIDGISPAAQLQIHHIFQRRRHSIPAVAQYAVAQSGIGQIELFLCLQDFLPL